jgi:Na+-driven multidrug efflux pump
MIKPRILLFSLVASVILFLIAMPFGTEKNHHSLSYEFGNVVWVLFLISVPVLIVLTIVFLVQRLFNRSRERNLLHGS